MSAEIKSDFERCLEHLPPCVGVDDAMHRVFVVTNEVNVRNTLKKLKSLPLTGNLFIGVSGFFSLNAVAVKGRALKAGDREINHILMIDCGARVEHFWQSVQEIIKKSSDRQEVFEGVKVLLKTECERYYKDVPLCTPMQAAEAEILSLQEEMGRYRVSWLSNDRRFQKIKKIFDEGRFLFMRMDFCDADGLGEIANILKSRDLVVDTLYLSNVLECIRDIPGKKEALVRAVEKLALPTTLLIDAPPRHRLSSKPLFQRLLLKSDFDAAVHFADSTDKKVSQKS